MAGEPLDPEEALIRAFISPEARRRFLELLSRPARRDKLLQRLAHCQVLDPRFAHRIPKSEQQAPHIESVLRRKRAPEECHVMSLDSALDGRQMPLTAALREIVGYGMGTLLSCVPGRLGYYEGEEQYERYILERKV